MCSIPYEHRYQLSISVSVSVPVSDWVRQANVYQRIHGFGPIIVLCERKRDDSVPECQHPRRLGRIFGPLESQERVAVRVECRDKADQVVYHVTVVVHVEKVGGVELGE